MTATTNRGTLREYRDEIFEINDANGWFQEGRPFDDDIALLHSEVSEAFEAFRDWGFTDKTGELCKERVNGWHDEDTHRCKPQGFGNEMADVLVRLLDTAYRYKVDFPWDSLREVEPYDDFDSAASVGTHVRELHALISDLTIELNEDLSRGLQMGPTLSYVVTLCDHLELDLEAELVRKLAYNRTRGFRHGGKRV